LHQPSIAFLSNVNSVFASVLPVVTPIQGLISSILSDATAIVLTVATPVSSIINGVLTNVTPAAASVLVPGLSVPVTGNGGGNIVASTVIPTISILPAVVNLISNVLEAALGGNILKEAVNSVMAGMSTAVSMTSPILADNPGVVTVTQVVSIVTIFVPTPPLTMSL
jgi:hypothetical protein